MATSVSFDNKILSSKVIICDIEGTTTSISFVKDTLFPYALKNVKQFLTESWNEDATKAVVTELRQLATNDINEKLDGAVAIKDDTEDVEKQVESIVKNVEWQMSNDRKVTPLKTLQGLIWSKGYKDGSIKGHVYDDVPKALETWSKSGHKIFIYSSGSVDAQKLLFGNTTDGNLMPRLSGYFDTKIGAKQEKDSYLNIVKEIECSADEVLFLTDIIKEAKAAKEAGLNVVVLDRPGNNPLSDEDRKEFPVIESFDKLNLEDITTIKRKIEQSIDQERPNKISKIENGDNTETKSTLDNVKMTNETEKDDTTKTVLKENEKTEVNGQKEEQKKTEAELEINQEEKTDNKPEKNIDNLIKDDKVANASDEPMDVDVEPATDNHKGKTKIGSDEKVDADSFPEKETSTIVDEVKQVVNDSKEAANATKNNVENKDKLMKTEDKIDVTPMDTKDIIETIDEKKVDVDVVKKSDDKADHIAVESDKSIEKVGDKNVDIKSDIIAVGKEIVSDELKMVTEPVTEKGGKVKDSTDIDMTDQNEDEMKEKGTEKTKSVDIEPTIEKDGNESIKLLKEDEKVKEQTITEKLTASPVKNQKLDDTETTKNGELSIKITATNGDSTETIIPAITTATTSSSSSKAPPAIPPETVTKEQTEITDKKITNSSNVEMKEDDKSPVIETNGKNGHDSDKENDKDVSSVTIETSSVGAAVTSLTTPSETASATSENFVKKCVDIVAVQSPITAPPVETET